MAPRTEQGEREFHQDINAAIAGTEDEIFREALGDELDDNDGDRELEEMGGGLEGDHLDEDDTTLEDPDASDEDDEAGEGDDDQVENEDDEDAEGDEEGEEDGEDEPQQRDARGRQEPRIPPSRLREVSERAREAEQREQQLRTELATVNARLNDVVTRLNTAPVAPKTEQAAPVKPDMFTDPEGYEKWVIEQAERRADEKLQARFNERDQQQQQLANQRVDQSFHNAVRSNRGFEFQPAFNALTSLDPKNPQHRATVQSIYNAPDPAQALFNWWDENGGDDYRQQIAEQLGFEQPQRQPNRGNQQRPQQRSQRDPSRQQQPAPRYEHRGPKPMRSLNSASGSNSHRQSNPEMLDGSDPSVFEFATRR